MRIVFFLFLSLLGITSMNAQKPATFPGGMKIGRVYGRILDEQKKPIAFATVALYISKGKKIASLLEI